MREIGRSNFTTRIPTMMRMMENVTHDGLLLTDCQLLNGLLLLCLMK
ncbi:hypothetical protein WN944_025242 [Citrus x changshan-huyou]|uniref:Uncharacterized protein n=1 Tax=Citrus x changshan-huyou TaxID=2935761 RepID=A0AAP0LQ23_9ROSI